MLLIANNVQHGWYTKNIIGGKILTEYNRDRKREKCLAAILCATNFTRTAWVWILVCSILSYKNVIQ